MTRRMIDWHFIMPERFIEQGEAKTNKYLATFLTKQCRVFNNENKKFYGNNLAGLKFFENGSI